VSQKYSGIDLFNLYAKGSANGWNDFLTSCYNENNINKLAKIRYQIQVGMDDISKRNLNDEKIIIFFIRLNRSLELTAKKIIRKMYPMPGDTVIKALNKGETLTSTEAKRKRDKALQEFFRVSAY